MVVDPSEFTSVSISKLLSGPGEWQHQEKQSYLTGITSTGYDHSSIEENDDVDHFGLKLKEISTSEKQPTRKRKRSELPPPPAAPVAAPAPEMPPPPAAPHPVAAPALFENSRIIFFKGCTSSIKEEKQTVGV